MLVETFLLIRRHLGLFIGYFLALCLPLVFADVFKVASGHGALLFLIFFLLRSVQLLVLSNDSKRALSTKGSAAYGMKHLILFVAAMTVAFVPMFAFGGSNLALTVLILCFVYPFILAAVGAWPLPGVQMSWALRCGLRNLWKTYGRLFLAFIAPIILGIACVSLLAAPSLIVDGKFNPAGTVAELLLQATQLVSLTYIGVVLSRNYIIFSQPEGPSIMLPPLPAEENNVRAS